MSLLSWTLFAALVAVTGSVFMAMDTVQPYPYLDEVFHVPQAQAYCLGNFKQWDDKITTLPGLYFISIGILTPLKNLAVHTNLSIFDNVIEDRQMAFCSTRSLRAINLLLIIVNALIIHKVATQIHGGKHYYDEGKVRLCAFNLAIFPVLYFFTFLYYTDVGSTFLVFFMYCLHLDHRDWLASFIGLLAVSFRQTNIIWVAFVAVQAMGPILIRTIHIQMLESKRPVRFSLTTSGQTWELIEGSYQLLFDPRRLLKFVGSVLYLCGGYLIVWLLFVTFVIWNNGIAVGDKTAHVATFHPTQILYFCMVSTVFSAPLFASKFKFFLHYARKHYIILAFCSMIVYIMVEGYTMAHPYLLADNRHYPFYVWRRIIARTDWSKHVLIPVYVYGGFCILYSIRKSDIIFKLSFPLFTFINLSPQLLLEFRYFIIPFLMFRLQSRPCNWWILIAETVLYVAVNAFTIALFIFKPFRWDHTPEEVQRFLW